MHSTFEIIEDSDSDEIGPELVTLETVKTELGITSTTEDTSLSARITQASNLIADYCGRRFAFATAVETFQLNSCESAEVLLLRLYPVVSVESVVMNDSEATDWEFDGESGELWLKSGRWSGRIVVTYSGGYLLPDETPGRLVAACIEAVSLRRTVSRRDPTIRDISHGDTRVSYFGINETAGQLVAPSVIELIKPFVRTPSF